VEHARTEYQSHHEEEGDSRIQDIVDDPEHLRLSEGADECQNISDEIEFPNLQLCRYRSSTPDLGIHTLVEKGSNRLKLPTKACKEM